MSGKEVLGKPLTTQEKLAALRQKEESLSKQMENYSLTTPDQKGFAQLFLGLQQVRSLIQIIQDSIRPAGPSPTTQDHTATTDPQGRSRWYKPRRSR